MRQPFFIGICALAVSTLISHTAAQAHVVCGDRVFPTTLTLDDPGTSNELSLPTITFTPTMSSENNVYAYEWDKLITDDLGFAVNGDPPLLHRLQQRRLRLRRRPVDFVGQQEGRKQRPLDQREFVAL